MRRTAVFILLCLLFGALLSVAVAWWAALTEWEDPETTAIEHNGWKAGVVYTPASTLIGAIHVDQMEYVLERYGIPPGSAYYNETSPPEWFSLSTKPANQNAIIRGIGAGWPLRCVVFVQEHTGESVFPEWELVMSGGIVGTNPLGSAEDFSWSRNHLPLQVVPMGFLVDALIYGAGVFFPVLVVRLNLRLRAKHHQRRKRCPHCKYDLSGSTSVLCSECGADPLRPPPIISPGITVVTGVVTIILLMALVGFGVSFSAKFPFSQLHYAAYHGDVRTVRNELAAGEDIDGTAPTYDWSWLTTTYTPLSLACASGETEVVQYLLDSSADLEMRNSDGSKALHMALESGSLDCLSLLLENGADANAKVGDDTDALWLIAYKPDYDPRLLDLLLDAGYSFEPRGKKVDLALLTATRRGNDQFIHRLLELGAVPGYGAMRGAVMAGRADWLRLFVGHGADVTSVPKAYWPFLHAVSPDNNPREIIEFLIQHGQQIDTADELGVTALMWVTILGNPGICRIFLEFGADPNLRDDSGKNALDHAIVSGADDIEGVVLVLLDAGAEVRLVDEKGEPRFDELDPELVKLLQENAASNSKEKQPGQ